MLLMRRERFFARVADAPGSGGTVLSLASLARGSGDPGPRFAALSGELRAALVTRAPGSGPEAPHA
jgi:cytochrome c biogenesis protein